jgi:two-component system sensor histidine kinase ResE
VVIFRSVVGKLWLTIIGLVAVVLFILGLFLVNYMQDYFSPAKDQKESLKKLATRFSAEATQHMGDPQFFSLSNVLLSNQDARMLVVGLDMKEISVPAAPADNLLTFHAVDFFSTNELKQVFSSGQVLTNQITYNQKESVRSGPEYVAVAVPLRSKEGVINGAMVIYQSLQSMEALQSYVIRLFSYVSLMGFLMTTFFAFFLFSRITRPLNQLKKAANLITHGEYGTRVPITSHDEIGELAKTFNLMGEKLQEGIKALSQEKEHLSSVLRSMTDAVITVDSTGYVILTNPQGERIIEEWGAIQWTDFPAGELPEEAGDGIEPIGDSLEALYIPEPLQALFDTVVTGSTDTSSKIHVKSEVWSVAMTPLYARDQVRGAVAVLRDVTEEHRLDKLRKDFVANVSHELRTPLSMLQGYSEALLDNIAATPEEQSEIAQVIYDESLRMGRLVRDLLDLARMEAGHLELSYREVDITSLLKRMHRKFAVLAKERGITLSVKLPEFELILQKADEDRLEQVLTNLLDNAFRHTPAGAGIGLKAEPAFYKDQPALRLEVTDEGQGIPIEDLPFIFERFYKADKARTRGSSGGTGLGLAIVKNIVDAHQGSVGAQSVVGQGTTFTIMLPCDLK